MICVKAYEISEFLLNCMRIRIDKNFKKNLLKNAVF